MSNIVSTTSVLWYIPCVNVTVMLKCPSSVIYVYKTCWVSIKKSSFPDIEALSSGTSEGSWLCFSQSLEDSTIAGLFSAKFRLRVWQRGISWFDAKKKKKQSRYLLAWRKLHYPWMERNGILKGLLHTLVLSNETLSEKHVTKQRRTGRQTEGRADRRSPNNRTCSM